MTFLARLALLAALAPVQAIAQGLSAVVTAHVVLPEVEVDGLTVGELSGLRWSETDGILVAVSDRARLVTLRVTLPPDGTLAIEPVAARPLRGADGAELDPDHFNPEALELAQAGERLELYVVSETGPAAAAFDMEGAWLRAVDLPEAVTDASRQRSEGDGLESVALHPVHGLLTVPEESWSDHPRELHTIVAQDGRTFAYDTTGFGETGRTSIKDMAVMTDGAVLILERERTADDRLVPYLRRFDPAACTEGALCPTEAARLDVPDVTDADFEGLALLSDGRALIVSDDKVDGDLRSVFALVEFARTP